MMECPVCGMEIRAQNHVKNGSWALEPLDHVEIDPYGYYCASWGSEHLTIYFHSKEQVSDDHIELPNYEAFVGWDGEPQNNAKKSIKKKIDNSEIDFDKADWIEIKCRFPNNAKESTERQETETQNVDFNNISIPAKDTHKWSVLEALYDCQDEETYMSSNLIASEIGYAHVSSCLTHLHDSGLVERKKSKNDSGGIKYLYKISDIGSVVYEEKS